MKARGLICLLLLAGLILFSCAVRNVEEATPSAKEKSVTMNKNMFSAGDVGNRRLDIIDIDGSFFSNSKIGQLYIIKGKIENNYPQSRSYILMKCTIEDSERSPIVRKLFYAGNTFTEQELKDISIKEIEDSLKNKSGRNNSNIDIAPDESVPFMVVFYNLPDNISEYVVETVSSSPGR